jgi:hypothetical protein
LLPIFTSQHNRFYQSAGESAFLLEFIRSSRIAGVNPVNLETMGKKQNNVHEYSRMMLAWKKYPVVITAGYIIGFANDTEASFLSDVQTIKKEQPIGLVYVSNLTPLPGSKDHRQSKRQGDWMDAGLNKLDLNHRVTKHPTMSGKQWDRTYRKAWRQFYTFDHMESILKRMTALGSNKKLNTLKGLVVYREFVRLCGVQPLEGELFRLKFSKDRRPSLPRENRFVFYLTCVTQLVRYCVGMAHTYLRLRRKLNRIWHSPDRYTYRDGAIPSPARAGE